MGHFPDIFRRDNTGHVSDSIAAHGDPEPTRQKSVLASILYKPPPLSVFWFPPCVRNDWQEKLLQMYRFSWQGGRFHMKHDCNISEVIV